MSQKRLFLLAKIGQTLIRILLVIAALLIGAVLVWQGITASGNPNPAIPHISQGAAIIDTGVLVLREGLECILVLSAITASMMGANREYRRPIALGAGIGLGACVQTGTYFCTRLTRRGVGWKCRPAKSGP